MFNENLNATARAHIVDREILVEAPGVLPETSPFPATYVVVPSRGECDCRRVRRILIGLFSKRP